jgi:hypothetical protein
MSVLGGGLAPEGSGDPTFSPLGQEGHQWAEEGDKSQLGFGLLVSVHGGVWKGGGPGQGVLSKRE